MSPATPIAQKAMTSPAEAQAVAAHLNEVMDALLEIVEQETELVRAGKIADAARLDRAKNDLTRLYVADTLQLSANRKYIESAQPALMQNLRQRHDSFHALLQINLTVLATAHAVAEGLVRGVSQELTRKSAPQVYGASGRHATPRANTSVPVALVRSL
jgi:hypothetical protein